MSDVAVPRASLNNLEVMLRGLGQEQQRILANMGQIEVHQAEMDNRLQSLMASFLDYVESDRKAKELQLAETRIVKVRQELEGKYGHHGEVRRRAVGVLQAVDVGLVTHETIQSTTEDVMMAAPQYWLAPALVAMAAWIRDDRELSQRAVAEALRRDMDKTSLFFSLVLRRYERRKGAARWLGQFFARQDPTALHREFVVILDAVATGAFGPEAKGLTSTTIAEWLKGMSVQSGFTEKQMQRWRTTLESLTPTIGDEEYALLRAHSATWSALEASLGAVRRNERVIDHFGQIFDGALDVPVRLEDQIDDLLTTLVARFDVEELPLRRQEAELATIIEFRGDTQAAERRFAVVRQALEETVDFPELLSNAAMHAEEAGASRGTQRMAVAMSRDWILAAHDALTAAAREEVPTQIDVKIGDWTDTVEQESDHDAVARDLAEHMDAQTAQRVAAIKFTGGPLAAAVAAPLALIWGIASGAMILIALAAAAAIYGGLAYRGLGGKRQAAREAGENEKRQALERLKGFLSEIVDYREEWARKDREAEEAHGMLKAISVSQYELIRSDDTRAVL